MKMMNTQIRAYKDSDHNFIMASFLRGVYYGNQFYSMVNKDIFMRNYKHIGEAIISQNLVLIACLPDDEDTILGYSIMTPDTTAIHWVYIKKDWRAKFGILQLLLPDTALTFSHFTTKGLELAKKLYPKITFDPFKLR